MGLHTSRLTTRPDTELARLFQEGESLALDVLLDRYRRFARSRSRHYFLLGGDREDLEQEALIGLYKAVRDYRPEHQVAFRPFAELCITRQIVSAIKAANRLKHRTLNDAQSFSIATTLGEEERSLDEILSAPSAPYDVSEQLVGNERIEVLAEAARAELTDLERDVLGLYLVGRSYIEIADFVGRPAKSVDNAVQRIKRKLGKTLMDYESASV